MTPGAAFLASYHDLRVKGRRRTVEVRARLPFGDYDRLTKGLGLPQAGGVILETRSVAVFACRNPQHPGTEADALAEAAIAYLETRDRLPAQLASRLQGVAERNPEPADAV